MKKTIYFPLLLLALAVILFFKPFFLNGQLPIPSDTIVGLYHPFRDFYANEYPNGIPYKNFLITDPVRQQYPWRHLAIENEKQGILPLWNPYTMSGTPLLANFQTAAFYPLNILLLILPFSLGWSFLVILQPILAGTFLYFYLRQMKLSPSAAILGGIVFAFCGFSTAWLEWNVIVHIALWLPLMLLTIEKLLYKHSLKWIIVFLFVQLAAFFAGHIQIYVYILLLQAAYFSARIYQITRQEKLKKPFAFALRKSLPFLIYGGIFLIIAAIQWIPTMQFIDLSARSVDQLNRWQEPGWFLPWQHLVQFIAPDFFGNPATLNYWGIWNYGEFVGYVGIFPLLMAIYALYNRKDKKTLFFGAFFFLSLIFSLPTVFAYLPYVLDIPFFSSSQPTRLLVVADFALAILAALGFDYFLRTQKKITVGYSLGVLLVILGGLWLFVYYGAQLIPTLSVENLAIAKRNLYFPTFIFAIIIVSIAIWLAMDRFKWFRKALNPSLLTTFLIIFLLGITLFDLLRFSQKFTPFTDSKYLYPSTKVLSYLQNQPGQFRVMATDSRILPPNFTIMYKIQSVDGYDPLYLLRYAEFITALQRNKPDINPPFGFNRIITPQRYESHLVDLLGVKYVLSLDDLKATKLQKVATEGQTKVYLNKESFPRAFFVENLNVAVNKNEAIQLLFDKALNLHTTAVIEDADQVLETSKYATGSASVVYYSENRIIVQTNLKNDGFLVLTDVHYPTWRAKGCNGTECTEFKIYPTDYLFRGVLVPSGIRHIEFYNSLL